MSKEKLTRSGALRLCRKLWRELGESGSDTKPAWADKYLNECPLCEYLAYTLKISSVGRTGAISSCHKHCPLLWPVMESKTRKGQRPLNVCSRGSLYHQWINTHPTKRRKALALQIANLPRKPIHKGAK